MQCPHCVSLCTKKNGHSVKGIQRHFCLSCSRTFIEIFDSRRISKDEEPTIIALRQEGKSIRAIADATGHSKSAVCSFLKKSCTTPREVAAAEPHIESPVFCAIRKT